MCVSVTLVEKRADWGGGGGCGGGGGVKGNTMCENNYVHIRIALELFELRCLASLYDL